MTITHTHTHSPSRNDHDHDRGHDHAPDHAPDLDEAVARIIEPLRRDRHIPGLSVAIADSIGLRQARVARAPVDGTAR